MSSIRVNYFVGARRTTTTFSELQARFYIKAQYLIDEQRSSQADDWVQIDTSNMFYRDRRDVERTFQEFINDLTKPATDKAMRSTCQPKLWSRQAIEYHILTTIGQAESINADMA